MYWPQEQFLGKSLWVYLRDLSHTSGRSLQCQINQVEVKRCPKDPSTIRLYIKDSIQSVHPITYERLHIFESEQECVDDVKSYIKSVEDRRREYLNLQLEILNLSC